MLGVLESGRTGASGQSGVGLCVEDQLCVKISDQRNPVNDRYSRCVLIFLKWKCVRNRVSKRFDDLRQGLGVQAEAWFREGGGGGRQRLELCLTREFALEQRETGSSGYMMTAGLTTIQESIRENGSKRVGTDWQACWLREGWVDLRSNVKSNTKLALLFFFFLSREYASDQ